MIHAVQQSLLGSILSNMMLVLGCAFFSGGIVFYKKDQVFNKVIISYPFGWCIFCINIIRMIDSYIIGQAVAMVSSGLLLMAVMGLLFLVVLHYTHTEVQFGKIELALSRFSNCIMLLAYVCYLIFQLESHRSLYDSVNEGASQSEESSHEDEVPDISKWEAIFWLAILTTRISVLSEYLAYAIKVQVDLV